VTAICSISHKKGNRKDGNLGVQNRRKTACILSANRSVLTRLDEVHKIRGPA